MPGFALQAAIVVGSVIAAAGAPQPPPFDEAAFLRELRAQPVVEVTCAVAPRGVAGVRGKKADEYTIMFGLQPWRTGAGAHRATELIVKHHGSRERIDTLRAELVPGTLLRIKARVLPRSAFPDPQAWLEEIVGRVDDPALAAERAKLDVPVTLDDPTLGTLTARRDIAVFEGRSAWNGTTVRVLLDGREKADAERALETAHALWRQAARWDRRVRERVVADLLEIRNWAWAEDDEPELDAREFNARIELETIHVAPDGRFEFWFDDGDLFGGHSIQVRGDLENGPQSAALAG